MIKINITDQEKQILKSYFKTTPLILIRLKSQAILLRSKAMKIVDIADVLGRDARTIKRWLKSFAERRLGSLFTLQANNQHAAKLTQTQKEAIKRVLSQKPSDQGLPGEFGMSLGSSPMSGQSSASSTSQSVPTMYYWSSVIFPLRFLISSMSGAMNTRLFAG